MRYEIVWLEKKKNIGLWHDDVLRLHWITNMIVELDPAAIRKTASRYIVAVVEHSHVINNAHQLIRARHRRYRQFHVSTHQRLHF